MRPLEKLGNAARVFCIAAVLGLSLALLDAVALQGTLVLAALAAIAIAADLSARLPQSWIVSTEAALAALVVGMALPQGILLLPYLVVPALVAGMTSGSWRVLVTVAIEVLGLSIVVVTSGQIRNVEALSEIVGPWLLTTLGVGLMGARARSLRRGGDLDPESAYENARRLLTQLRTVARRLSSGLDPVGLASQLLTTVHEHLDDTHSGVFVKSEGGVLAPLAYRGARAREALKPVGSLVDRCWAEMAPAFEVMPTGLASQRHRTALPLRVGNRMLGMVVLDSPAPTSTRTLDELMREVDEHALRLDAALTFDEIRTIATMQERHRLAREIHDGIAQEIASLGYVVDDLTASATSDSQKRKLHSLRGELTRVVSELRLSIFDLRSELSAGLGSALSEHVREVGARSGITVHMTLDEAPTRLRGEVETELFRIAQEAITNARKHSRATNLWIDCRIRPPEARISVRDDGGGLGRARDDSYGMKIMRERAQRIGATLEVANEASGDSATGTRVTVTVSRQEELRA